MKPAITIKLIPVRELEQFARASRKPDEVNPITPARGRSQSRNPYADPEDIGLLVAYCRNRCVGYLSIIPGLLDLNDRAVKFVWGSTWYVLPEFRRSRAAFLLARRVMERYDIIATHLSGTAEKVLRGLKFQELGTLTYYVLKIKRVTRPLAPLRLLQKILARKFPNGKPGRVLDGWLKSFAYTLISRAFCLPRDYSLREVDKIEDNQVNPLPPPAFRRGAEIINWMMQEQWIEVAPEKKEEKNYYFSHRRDYFRYLSLEVYSLDRKDYRGLVVLSISSWRGRTALKVLDFFFLNPLDRKFILPIALKYRAIYRADEITLPEVVIRLLKRPFLFQFLASRRKQVYLYHPRDRESPSLDLLRRVKLSYYDGETAFT